MNKYRDLSIWHWENSSWRLSRWLCLAVVVVLLTAGQGLSQSTVPADIQAHLAAGEFPVAIELANRLPAEDRDQWLARISLSQMDAGATDAAYQTAESVAYDLTRSNALNELADKRLGRSGVAGGQAGGITILDFRNLIDLIQNTIASDSWEDTGTGLGTIQAFPSGVYVDASGTLKRIRSRNTQAGGVRDFSHLDSGNREVAWQSKMRKVSITRLEKAAQLLAAQGKPADATMLNLAGIFEIKYLMIYPETGDIVIAGPAGPWERDRENRAVNVKTGKPVLQLDDLVVCLRNAWDENGKFGCSIVPRKENLAKTKKFLASGDAAGKQWAEKLRQMVGQQDIEMFGIDPETHAARVVVEADYRMKLVGMGLDPSIPEVPSYLDRVKLKPDGTAPDMDIVRWWFTLNYDDIVANENRTLFSFTGTGVQVLSENEFIDNQGERIHTGKSNDATQGFARDFTLNFDKLADKYPVYRQMKNVFDLALVSNIIRQQGLSQKAEWNQTFFASPAPGRLSYVVRTATAPHQVDSVMNEKTIRVRKESSTVIHQIVGVSGGVLFDANDLISKEMVVEKGAGELENRFELGKPRGDEITWWWD